MDNGAWCRVYQSDGGIVDLAGAEYDPLFVALEAKDRVFRGVGASGEERMILLATVTDVVRWTDAQMVVVVQKAAQVSAEWRKYEPSDKEWS